MKEKRKNSLFHHLYIPLGGSRFSLRTRPAPKLSMTEDQTRDLSQSSLLLGVLAIGGGLYMLNTYFLLALLLFGMGYIQLKDGIRGWRLYRNNQKNSQQVRRWEKERLQRQFARFGKRR